MPSTAKMLFDVAFTAAILTGGAWLAAHLSTPAAAVGETQVSGTQNLELHINSIRNDKGNVIILVFDSENAFASEDPNKAVDFRELKAQKGKMVVDFPSLTAGPYAVSLFHDENSDYEFNMIDGIPLEGYGVSGAKHMYDSPPFARAKTKAGKVDIAVHYIDPKQ